MMIYYDYLINSNHSNVLDVMLSMQSFHTT